MSSTTTIRYRYKVGGVLADADAVYLQSPDDSFGVKRRDTGAVVVASGTEMERVSTGVYAYTFDDPASGLEYIYYVRAERSGHVLETQDNKLGGRGGNLYDLIPRILPRVSGCPLPLLKQQMRATGKDFFFQTELWREDLTYDSVEDQAEYDLTHDRSADIDRVEYVKVDETNWRYAVHHTSDVLLLQPCPNADDQEIVARVVFRPWASCDTYPADLLSLWDQAIIEGTLMRLYPMKDVPWRDGELFQLAERNYTRLCGSGRGSRVDGRSDANVKVRRRRFI